MMDNRHYRLAFILPHTQAVLAVEDEEGSEMLPVVTVRSNERFVEQLNCIAAGRWHLETVVLDVNAETLTDLPCVLMEVRSECPPRSLGDFRPVSADKLSALPLSPEARTRLQACFSRDSSRQHPFAKVGWIEDVQNWIQEGAPNRVIRFTGEVRQLNAGGGFELCRLGVHNGPAYWLKAVGPPNLHEFSITQQLAKSLPRYLPPIVAMREDWKAWVMEEEGHPLEEAFTLSNLKAAVAGLAEMQAESIPHAQTLGKAGCTDASIKAIEAHLPAIREYLEEAMAQQTSVKVAPLERSRLRELEGILRSACCKMQDLGIPDTLIHNDINAGNILVCGARCLFIDWAEAQIGNPFMTLQHVCAQIARDMSDHDKWRSDIRNSYKGIWRNWLSDSQIDEAYALMPILAIVSCLYGRGTWLSSPERDLPHFQLYARSLARHIDRAARSEEFEEALCQ